MDLLDYIDENGTNTDKHELGYIHAFYDKLLSPIEESAKNILEIGIYSGDSILLWRDYFPNATIHGLDISHCPKIDNEERIIQDIQDAYSPECYANLLDNFYDVIIDDGPHTLESMIVFLEQYPAKLNKGGILVLEDIIDTSWTQMLVDKLDPNLYQIEVVHMANRQLSQYLRDRWTNGLDVIIAQKI